MAFVAWLLIPTSWKVILNRRLMNFTHQFGNQASEYRFVSFWGHMSDSKHTLIEKGRDHSRIISDINLQLNRKDFLKDELKNLKKIKSEIALLENELNLDARIEFYPEIARVSLRNISSWTQNLIINKGRNYEIKKVQV